jgi:poly(hydroxyalkanoate) granule-associated protein
MQRVCIPFPQEKTMKRSKRNTGLAAVRKLGNAAIAGVEAARETAAVRLEDARSRTVQAVNQLEKAFESRVTRAMSRLGVPTAREVRALAREVASLKASVLRLSRTRARA